MCSPSSRRKCRCCNEFFVPDFRNRQHQLYCPKPACRAASKRASQRRWLRQPANRDYFRGPENLRRVQQWRQAHPGYWKKQPAASLDAQPVLPQQVNSVNAGQSSCNAPRSPLGTLQDLSFTRHPAFIGLISMVTGTTLQEDIAATTRKLEARGRDILGLVLPGLSPNVYDYQTPASTRAAAPGA